MLTDSLTSVIDCPRCGGAGRLDCFSHVNGGICFLCDGAKVVDEKVTIKAARAKKLYIRYKKEWIHTYDQEWIHNESNFISWDGGNSSAPGTDRITDENREEKRKLWRWAVANGAIHEKRIDNNPLPPNKRPKIKAKPETLAYRNSFYAA